MEYVLIVKYSVTVGRKHWETVVRFTWKDKADALACKALLEKAERSKFSSVTFLEHIPDKPLS